MWGRGFSRKAVSHSRADRDSALFTDKITLSSAAWQWWFVVLGAVLSTVLSAALGTGYLFWAFLPYLLLGCLILDLPASVVAVAACVFLEDSVYLLHHGASFSRALSGDVLVFTPAFIIAILRGLVGIELRRSRRAEELFHLLDMASDAVIIRDASTGIITFWSHGAEVLYGWDSGEVIGKTTSEVLGSSITIEDVGVQDRLKSGKVWSGEIVQHKKSGEKLIVYCRAFLDNHGRLLGVNTDISDRKRAEVAELEVKERDAFISVAAHELKTPISSIYIVVELLNKKLSEEKLNGLLGEYVKIIQRQSTRLSMMIDRILTASRLAHNHLSLELSAVDLVTMVDTIVKTQLFVDSQSRIKLLAPEALVVQVDGMRIEQAIINLVANAVQYSPEDGEIVVTVEERAGEAAVSVRDHGLGIPAEAMPYLFQQFFRAHDSTHRSGMGLGLYISQRIAQQHGGRIEVECPDDGGSLFTLYLPMEVVE